jgi:preprotein translocase subunit SecG
MGTYVLISVLVVITCILLILIVLVQNSKGGGLASNFASNNQIMGVRKTTDFLEKSTWTLAIVLLVLSLTSTLVIPRGTSSAQPQSEIQKMIPVQEASPFESGTTNQKDEVID